MTVSNSKISIPRIVRELENSNNYNFYLDEVRMKIYHSLYQTWNFYVNDSNEVRNWLINKKFTKCSNNCLSLDIDGDTLLTYHYGSHRIGYIVYVRTVKSAELKFIIKNKILNSIYPDGLSNMNPEQRKKIWEVCYKLYDTNYKIKEIGKAIESELKKE